MSAFKKIVDSLEPSDYSMERLIAWFDQNQAGDRDVAYLAKTLAHSGTVLTYNDGNIKADIASTGGPGSLTTILCPLFLRAFGFVVPKLGVPGRPAGGIDVLSQIPGYKYDLTNQEIKHILTDSGYAHFLASDRYAPLDAKLFEYRKKHGALAYPPIVIASILAKKIAVGVQLAGLDIRVAPHGNFGTSWSIARENAQRFCRVAALVGCQGVCFLTNNDVPPQPYIGRGESLVALYLYFEEKEPAWLRHHVDMCYAMSLSLAAKMNLKVTAYPSRSELLEIFGDHLSAQGTTFAAFKQRIVQWQKEPVFELKAQEDGFLVVDLECIRENINRFQVQAANEIILFPDPCGIILEKRPGQHVRKGEKIASIRFSTKIEIKPADLFREAVRVQPCPQRGLMFEEVRYE